MSIDLTAITMTPEQETRLRELAHFLRTGITPPSATYATMKEFPYFNMGIWRGGVSEETRPCCHVVDSLTTCGTSCCIGGYYELFWGQDEANCETIGLHWRLREHLFYPNRNATQDNPWFDCDATWNATPDQAADAIERAIEMAPKAPVGEPI